MTGKLVPLLLIFALMLGFGALVTDSASAQYGAGFTRSPIAIQSYPYGQVVGIIPGGYGYSNGYGYGMGYGGGYGGYGFGGYGGSGLAISSGPFGTNVSYYSNQPAFGGNYGMTYSNRHSRRHHHHHHW